MLKIGILLITLLCLTGCDTYAPKSTSSSNTIVIPLGECTFLDVDIPSTSKLLYTNYYNQFNYDNIYISKQIDALVGEPLGSKVYHHGSDFIWRKAGTWYVSANSIEGYTGNTYKSFTDNNVYTYTIALDSLEKLPDLPIDTVDTYNLVDTWGTVSPKDVNIKGDDITYYNPTGFIRTAVKYTPMSVLLDDTLAQFHAFGEQPLRYWYGNGIFYAESENFYVGMREINYNTTYTIYGKSASLKPYLLKSLRGDAYEEIN